MFWSQHGQPASIGCGTGDMWKGMTTPELAPVHNAQSTTTVISSRNTSHQAADFQKERKKRKRKKKGPITVCDKHYFYLEE